MSWAPIKASGYYCPGRHWFAAQIRRGKDWRAVRWCKHKHRTRAAADRCAVRLARDPDAASGRSESA